MIELTKLNGGKLVVNCELIEFVEALPDSLIKLTTGKKIMVKENIAEIIAAVVDFRKRISGHSKRRSTRKEKNMAHSEATDNPPEKMSSRS